MITKTETVDALKEAIVHFSEDQVKDFGEFCLKRAEELKAQRQDRARHDAQAEVNAAMERARALCEKHGIEFKPDNGKKGKVKKTAKPGMPVFKAHHRYEHPDDSSKVWTGNGVRPKWVNELLTEGRTPIDKGPVKAS